MRRLLALVITCSIIVGIPTAFSATPKVGAKCIKAGEFVRVSKQILVCTKIKTKLNWKLASASQTLKYLAVETAKSIDAANRVINEAKAAADKATANKIAADQAALDTKAAADKAAADKAAADLKLAAELAAKAEKLVADAKKCISVGTDCVIGGVGPGGGIVFFDAGKQMPWGRYLEFAPKEWSGSTIDSAALWCDLTNVSLLDTITDASRKLNYGTDLGKGKLNTNLMTSKCTSGAGVMASNYRGGGMTDWFLPSRDELNELCKFARSQPTGDTTVSCDRSGSLRDYFNPNAFYWSSTEINAQSVWQQYFGSGNRNDIFKNYSASDFAIVVKPIRSF